jgi:hypothetical protein
VQIARQQRLVPAHQPLDQLGLEVGLQRLVEQRLLGGHGHFHRNFTVLRQGETHVPEGEEDGAVEQPGQHRRAAAGQLFVADIATAVGRLPAVLVKLLRLDALQDAVGRDPVAVADAAPAGRLVVGVGAGHLRREAVKEVEDARGFASINGAGQADDLLRGLGQVVHGIALVAVDALV